MTTQFRAGDKVILSFPQNHSCFWANERAGVVIQAESDPRPSGKFFCTVKIGDREITVYVTRCRFSGCQTGNPILDTIHRLHYRQEFYKTYRGERLPHWDIGT